MYADCPGWAVVRPNGHCRWGSTVRGGPYSAVSRTKHIVAGQGKILHQDLCQQGIWTIGPQSELYKRRTCAKRAVQTRRSCKRALVVGVFVGQISDQDVGSTIASILRVFVVWASKCFKPIEDMFKTCWCTMSTGG